MTSVRFKLAVFIPDANLYLVVGSPFNVKDLPRCRQLLPCVGASDRSSSPSTSNQRIYVPAFITTGSSHCVLHPPISWLSLTHSLQSPLSNSPIVPRTIHTHVGGLKKLLSTMYFFRSLLLYLSSDNNFSGGCIYIKLPTNVWIVLIPIEVFV